MLLIRSDTIVGVLRPRWSNTKQEICVNNNRENCGILTSIGFVTRRQQKFIFCPWNFRPLQQPIVKEFQFRWVGFEAPSSVKRFPAHGWVSLSHSQVSRSASSLDFCHKNPQFASLIQDFVVANQKVFGPFGRESEERKERGEMERKMSYNE